MATIVRIKRSSVAGNPSTLAAGELAYSALPDSGSNGGDRLYIGMGTETSGNAANHVVIGGKYFTDLLDHAPGVLTPSSALVVDGSGKLDDFKVDNIQINGNDITSTNTNGNILITPNGSGNVVLDGQYWPNAIGSNGSFLKTDGSGNLSWAAVPSGSFSIAGGTGTDTFTTGETLTFAGSGLVTTTVTDNTVTISASGSVTIGTTAIAVGSSSTTLAGLTQLTVDNIDINGNEISSTNTNGNISLNPNGTGSIDVNSAKITNLGPPSADTDAATKAYVDNAVAGLTWKEAVNLLATTNVPLTGSTGTVVIDSHAALTSTNSGYRLLLKGQSTAADNGIYDYTDNGTTYTLTRAVDSDTYQELIGATVFVMEGTAYAGSAWVQSNHYLTAFTGQTWVQFSGADQIDAGDGLTKTGTTINVGGTADRISVSANAVDIASTYAGQSSITTLGTIGTGVWQGTAVGPAYGGTGQSTYTLGDTLYSDASNSLAKLPIGTSTQMLHVSPTGIPAWTARPDANNTYYATSISDTVSSIAVGGATAELASVWKARTIVQALDQILFPDVAPTYTIPTLSLSGSQSGTKEIGSTISQALTLTATENDAGIFTALAITRNASSISSVSSPTGSATTDIAAQFGYTDPNNPNNQYTLSFTDNYTVAGGTTTWSGTSAYNAGLAKQNNKGAADGRTAAVRSVNAPQASSSTLTPSSTTVTGIYPYFWGKSSTEPTAATVAAAIQAGTATKVLTAASGTLTITPNATSEYIWIAHETSYTTKTKWYNTALNNGDIGAGNFILSPVSQSVTSPEAYWSGVTFKIYISGYATNTSGSYEFRNT